MIRTTWFLAGTALLAGLGFSILNAGEEPAATSVSSSLSQQDPSPSPGLTCQQYLDAAVASMRQDDFDAALDAATKGLEGCPNDPNLNEFRALALFGKGNYHDASAALHTSMIAKPAWAWTTIGRLYPDVATYTKHLRSLESFTRKHPDDNAARFLQAYHYIAIGYPDAAVRELEMVVRLDGSDRVAAELLKGLPKPLAFQQKLPSSTGVTTQRPNY